jgi:hypothetical protein
MRLGLKGPASSVDAEWLRDNREWLEESWERYGTLLTDTGIEPDQHGLDALARHVDAHINLDLTLRRAMKNDRALDGIALAITVRAERPKCECP